ncbi:unnamed protein product [Lota lota]
MYVSACEPAESPARSHVSPSLSLDLAHPKRTHHLRCSYSSNDAMPLKWTSRAAAARSLLLFPFLSCI